jgi:tetratricopeptide (TPR) repeat protein
MRILIVVAALAFAPSAFAQTEAEKLQQCREQIDRDAEVAYQDGLSWLARGNRPAARHCTALALIALGQEAEGAARLEELANAPDAGGLEERALYLTQAGNAWLMARMPDAAVVTLTNALKLRPNDGELFKDRARAHLALKKWREAASDLDSAIALSAADAEAFRMRGHARMKMGDLLEAWADVDMAMKYAPEDLNVLVLRGDVREAMRLAGIDDPAGLRAEPPARARIVGN